MRHVLSPTAPRSRRIHAGAVAVTAAGLLSGCRGVMSTMDAASAENVRLVQLGRMLIESGLVVWIVVMAIVLVAAARRGRATDAVDLTPRGHGIVIYGGAVIPALILIALFIASLGAMRRYPTPADAAAITFRVTGRQWWWEIEYLDSTGTQRFRTANEIHVPVGRPVRLVLVSGDVIHSFWVPQLQGKMDLIPGTINELRFTALRPGVYRGQCAEYCGLQHAHMGLLVIAERPDAFDQWVRTQASAAMVPSDSALVRGEQLVTSGPCASCHAIRGTAARGHDAPDLTHVGSRLTLAAGALPNDLAAMIAWITDAQALKPGAQMPSLPQFTGVQLRAMAAYLRALR